MRSRMTLYDSYGSGIGVRCRGLAAGPCSGCATERTAKTISAETVLRQMSQKISTAKSFSFEGLREIESGLAGGDGLHGNTRIAVTVQRPDKMAARAVIPGDTRCLLRREAAFPHRCAEKGLLDRSTGGAFG